MGLSKYPSQTVRIWHALTDQNSSALARTTEPVLFQALKFFLPESVAKRADTCDTLCLLSDRQCQHLAGRILEALIRARQISRLVSLELCRKNLPRTPGAKQNFYAT